MSLIRFALVEPLTANDRPLLEDKLRKTDPHIDVIPSSPTPGVALADLIISAFITGGAAIVAAAIISYVNFIVNKKPASSPTQPTMLLITGTLGKRQLPIIDGRVDPDKLDAAVGEVGEVTEVTETVKK
jgi:hypothetical protein